MYGQHAKDCETILTTANEALITTTQRLEPSENFTIQLDLAEPNALVIPSTLEKQGFTWWIWPLFVFIPLPLVIMAWLWWRHGRDWVSGSPHVLIEPGSYSQRLRGILERRTAPFVYEPFTDLTPAEVEAIQTENITPKSLVSEILDLARQKYLKIETRGEKLLEKIPSTPFQTPVLQ